MRYLSLVLLHDISDALERSQEVVAVFLSLESGFSSQTQVTQRTMIRIPCSDKLLHELVLDLLR